MSKLIKMTMHTPGTDFTIELPEWMERRILSMFNAEAKRMAKLDHKWWITTDALERGGKKVKGPYPSDNAAIIARAKLEEGSSQTYWVYEEASND